MDDTTTGSCLCGAVTFRVTGAFERFFLCHCSRCRKDTGSAHAANLFATAARLDWLTGADNVGRFRLPGTRHEKSFCRTCGSALPTVQDAGAGAVLVVPAGALDGPVDLTPAAKICYADRAGWVDGLDRVPTLDGLPG
ncbi:MAG: GFA family protein [Maritimibacter sp.]|nr:GFA family protein [Maritimibacter sp.]